MGEPTATSNVVHPGWILVEKEAEIRRRADGQEHAAVKCGIQGPGSADICTPPE